MSANHILPRLPHTGTALDAIQELTPEGIEFIQQHIQRGQELEAQFPCRGVENPKRATAYHEAGHAVLYHSTGWRWSGVGSGL
jgi:hypothetical protein